MTLSSLSSSDLTDLAGRFDRPEITGAGVAYILAFDAVRERSGRRWALRQENLREYAERQFEKHFLIEDALVQLDEVNFLLVQPNEMEVGARSRALKLLRNVLEHFIGSSARADIKLLKLTGIGPAGVESEPVLFTEAQLTQNAAFDWDRPRDSSSRPAKGLEADTPAIGSGMQPIDAGGRQGPSALIGDRNYEAVYLTEPIWGVQQRAVVSYLLSPLVFERLPDRLVQADTRPVSAGDLVRMDLATLAEAQRLFREQPSERRFALHVPIHIASLGATSGRARLLDALAKLQPLATSSVIVVLKGLDAGAPQSLLIEVTSLLKRQCRAVVALSEKLDPKIDRWRDAQLSGIGVDLRSLAAREGNPTVHQLADFATRMKGVAPTLFAYSASTSSVLLAAWAAGFSHIGGEVVGKGCFKDLVALRVQPVDLYRDRDIATAM